ncbi:uncharacterized protein [Symphalangus syndactylus]|uniref:uncharacterized protein isoform X1 n=2 Tax=Symphalangus syndactylus TaxID=9590 RepID=UPI002442649F|nr:uncharacterized protein LOC129483284 isoform X1 [Symphalangus syndactylus]
MITSNITEQLTSFSDVIPCILLKVEFLTSYWLFFGKLQATIPASTVGESQLWRADLPGEELGFDTIFLVQAVDLVWAPDYLACPQESQPPWNNSWPTQPAPFRKPEERSATHIIRENSKKEGMIYSVSGHINPSRTVLTFSGYWNSTFWNCYVYCWGVTLAPRRTWLKSLVPPNPALFEIKIFYNDATIRLDEIKYLDSKRK